MVKGGFSWSLRGTTRITSPNLLLRAQNLKVILSLSEFDTNASQACSCSTWQGMADALSCRCWLHPWGRCRTATLCTHCFFQCTQFVDTGQTVKYILVSISILFLTSGQMLTVDFVPDIFVFWSLLVHRFILECNKISIFVFRTYFWTKK